MQGHTREEPAPEPSLEVPSAPSRVELVAHPKLLSSSSAGCLNDVIWGRNFDDPAAEAHLTTESRPAQVAGVSQPLELLESRM